MMNVGFYERLIRAGVAKILIFLFIKGKIRGMFGGLLMVVAGMLLSSAASGSCFLYEQLGISTYKEKAGH